MLISLILIFASPSSRTFEDFKFLVKESFTNEICYSGAGTAIQSGSSS